MERINDDAAEAGIQTPGRSERAPLGSFTRRSLDNSIRLAGASPHNTTPNSVTSTLESSPDEMVIRFRGRRNPSTWSPYSVKGVKKLCQDATPTKGNHEVQAFLLSISLLCFRHVTWKLSPATNKKESVQKTGSVSKCS